MPDGRLRDPSVGEGVADQRRTRLRALDRTAGADQRENCPRSLSMRAIVELATREELKSDL